MTTITTLEELREAIESGNYNYYGLRGAHESDLEKLERGYLDCSYWWERDEPTDESLSGTCALGVNEYISDEEIFRRYTDARDFYGRETQTVLLIADKNQEYGADENEVILGSNGYGADVIAIVKL
ncbi:MAG: hypothetical protein IJX77_03630 [Ruminococcus sp.]|nr:hypothetical protein [Ruminococcus sp.]